MSENETDISAKHITELTNMLLYKHPVLYLLKQLIKYYMFVFNDFETVMLLTYNYREQPLTYNDQYNRIQSWQLLSYFPFISIL